MNTGPNDRIVVSNAPIPVTLKSALFSRQMNENRIQPVDLRTSATLSAKSPGTLSADISTILREEESLKHPALPPVFQSLKHYCRFFEAIGQHHGGNDVGFEAGLLV